MHDPQILNTVYRLMRMHRLTPAALPEAVALALPQFNQAGLKPVILYLREALTEIGEHFATMVDPTNLNHLPENELKAWLEEKYDWLDAAGLEMAYKDGLQYAIT